MACGTGKQEGSGDLSQCADEKDNDRDGLTDCEDPDCIAQGACEGKVDSGIGNPDKGPDFCDPCKGKGRAWDQVVTGEEITCALDEAGWGRCWGEEDEGQL